MTADLVQRIQKQYPDLQVHSVREVDAGQVNTIIILNESLVFRFPKTPSGVDQLLTELTVLRLARAQTTLPIPEPIYTRVASRAVGEVFAGHCMLAGEPLGKQVDRLKADPVRLRTVADDLAGFMRELHRVPVPPDAGIPAHDAGRREGVPQLRELVREKLLPLARLSNEQERQVLAAFENFLADPGSFGYTQTLRHGDLGPGNILIDPGSLALSGVIDFGSAGLDDPAADVGFVLLWGTHLFGAPFAERVLDQYGADASMRNRAAFFRMAIALTVALSGLESGNQGDLDFGLSAC